MTAPRIIVLLGVIGVGCADTALEAEPPELDRAVFETQVYPVLLRDCGFPSCHASSDRFFQVYGPGRTRLDPSVGLNDAPTPDELSQAFDRSRSMAASTPVPEESLLLRKPLAEEAGGAGHEGLDAFGRNVYLDPTDPGYRVLVCWATANRAEGCP
ncbi:MAG: hypothetical protein AAGF12_19650 [Myxococcota bacterium]